MSILSTSIKFLRQAAALLLLPWLAWSCEMVTDDYDDEIDVSGTSQYINITISVGASSRQVTRSPLGGEYGDGTEMGIETRENEVNNITLIFYQDPTDTDPNLANTNINTTSDNAKVVCVKRYGVRPFVASNDLPNSHNHKTSEPSESSTAINQEVLYTTGNQRLDQTDLELGKTYKVLVVANAVVDVKTGDKIKDVREKVLSEIYTGSGLGVDASNFVMTSAYENDNATVTLTNPTIDTENGENRYIYYFDCIHIERLAARIDYCTRGATYNETYGGFVYEKAKGGNKKDLYVVTKVTPFNLYNESEYLFKRVRNNWTDATPVITYLGDESTTNYVVDPLTAGKNDAAAAQALSYYNRLNALLPVPGNPNNDTNPYSQVMADVYTTSSFIDGNNDNCIIIAYPRENTLKPNSLLKLFATGIVFEVDVYRDVDVQGGGPGGGPGGNPRRETRKYYHYLRHQGEPLVDTHSYKAERLEGLKVEQDNSTCGDVPMKCGIVRNNIYRVSIASFSDEDGTITLTIEEEKWRHVDNPTIYI